jgi:hypothetical protein
MGGWLLGSSKLISDFRLKISNSKSRGSSDWVKSENLKSKI